MYAWCCFFQLEQAWNNHVNTLTREKNAAVAVNSFYLFYRLFSVSLAIVVGVRIDCLCSLIPLWCVSVGAGTCTYVHACPFVRYFLSIVHIKK